MKVHFSLVLILLLFGTKVEGQLNQSTARNQNYLQLGDLLATYATKPKGLKLISCVEGGFQTLGTATYEVNGVLASMLVERYLKEKYQMSGLKFICCGWESYKNGQYRSPRLLKIDKDAVMIITMNSEETLEKDRKKVGKFYVTVKIVSI